MDVQAIREAVADRLGSIGSVRPFPFPPDQVPATVDSPVVAVANGDPYVDYHQAFAGGLAIVNLVLSAYVPETDPKSAWSAVDALVSSGSTISRSLVDTMMGSDRTLGGVCADIVVDQAVIKSLTDNNVRWLVADFNVRVMVGRT